MKLDELERKANFERKTTTFLKSTDTVEEGDWVEWTRGAWTTVDSGSMFIRKTPPTGLDFIRLVSLGEATEVAMETTIEGIFPPERVAEFQTAIVKALLAIDGDLAITVEVLKKETSF